MSTKAFRLTDTENEVLDFMVNTAGGGPIGHWLYPDADDEKRGASRLFWRMLGERHGFDPLTVRPLGDCNTLDFTAELLGEG
jgi:hypothetical protein